MSNVSHLKSYPQSNSESRSFSKHQRQKPNLHKMNKTSLTLWSWKVLTDNKRPFNQWCRQMHKQNIPLKKYPNKDANVAHIRPKTKHRCFSKTNRSERAST